MNLISLKPCDNTFFGDGNQFKFDISKVLKSKNIPYPSVFFGAIFTAILSFNDEFRKEFFEIGRYDHENILTINQVYLYNSETDKVYLKAPLDLFMKTKKEKIFGEFKDNNSRLSSLSYEKRLYSPKNKDYMRATNKYININNIFDGYLKRQPFRIELIDEKDIFVKGYKVGIGMNKETKSVYDGRLYKIEQTEFKDNSWCYIVDYDICERYLKDNYKNINVRNLEYGYLKLGGENKVCRYKKIKNSDIQEFNTLKNNDLKGNNFKILLTSDSYFKNSINKSFEDVGFKIVGLANDKPIYIGGYDMQENKNIRKMYKGYTAGTVILAKSINDKSINDIEEMKNSKGFNRYVILKGDF